MMTNSDNDDILYVYSSVGTIAIVKGEHQWGLQLTDILIDSGRESDRAKELRGICLRCL